MPPKLYQLRQGETRSCVSLLNAHETLHERTANVSAGHYLLPDLKAVFVFQSFRAKSDLERYKLWFEFLCRSYIKFIRYG